MAKEVAGLIKLQIKGGAANPSPPVGPALGSKGINIMGFCKEFNARTQDKAGKIIPVVITYYADKSFSFVIKTPPAAVQLKEAAKVQTGSAQPNRKKVATVTWDQNTQTATGKKGDRTVTVTIGSKTMYVNNTKYTLDTPPMVVSGRTLVPARAIAEGLGASVSWNQENAMVSITPMNPK